MCSCVCVLVYFMHKRKVATFYIYIAYIFYLSFLYALLENYFIVCIGCCWCCCCCFFVAASMVVLSYYFFFVVAVVSLIYRNYINFIYSNIVLYLLFLFSTIWCLCKWCSMFINFKYRHKIRLS